MGVGAEALVRSAQRVAGIAIRALVDVGSRALFAQDIAVVALVVGHIEIVVAGAALAVDGCQ